MSSGLWVTPVKIKTSGISVGGGTSLSVMNVWARECFHPAASTHSDETAELHFKVKVYFLIIHLDLKGQFQSSLCLSLLQMYF